MRKIIGAMGVCLGVWAGPAGAGFLPEPAANVFQPNSSYRCKTAIRGYSAELGSRAEWQKMAASALVHGFSFNFDLEELNSFIITAEFGLVAEVADYEVTIVGHSIIGDEQIMFEGDFGRGFIMAIPFQAGIEFPVQMTWKSRDTFYSTAYLYCSYAGPVKN